MDPLTSEEIAAAFDPEDELYLPDLSEINWDALDYLGWIHPSGHLGFVVLQSPNDGCLKGIKMRRSPRSAKEPRMEMCSWCHHVHKTDGTAMFTVSVKGSNGRHTLGNIVCKDLDCSLRIRNMVTPDSQMSETLYQPAKIWRMQKSMHKWFERANRI